MNHCVPKHYSCLCSGWRFTSIARYGAIVAALGLFFTEWRLVTRNLPLYNIKYENMDYEFLREQDRQKALEAEEAKAKAAERAAAAK